MDTELVSQRYALCFGVPLQGVPGFLRHSRQISLGVYETRDTGPRESIVEEWTVSLKTVQFASGSSELGSIASNRMQISLMKACLLLSCFSLETYLGEGKSKQKLTYLDLPVPAM